MKVKVEFEVGGVEAERSDQYLAEVKVLPGCMAYGTTEREARINTAVLALRVLADRIEHREPTHDLVHFELTWGEICRKE